MRISDWSSDVCSSDLHPRDQHEREHRRPADGSHYRRQHRRERGVEKLEHEHDRHPGEQRQHLGNEAAHEPEHSAAADDQENEDVERSEEHTSELQSLMRISYAVFCLKKKNITKRTRTT